MPSSTIHTTWRWNVGDQRVGSMVGATTTTCEANFGSSGHGWSKHTFFRHVVLGAFVFVTSPSMSLFVHRRELLGYLETQQEFEILVDDSVSHAATVRCVPVPACRRSGRCRDQRGVFQEVGAVWKWCQLRSPRSILSTFGYVEVVFRGHRVGGRVLLHHACSQGSFQEFQL